MRLKKCEKNQDIIDSKSQLWYITQYWEIKLWLPCKWTEWFLDWEFDTDSEEDKKSKKNMFCW